MSRGSTSFDSGSSGDFSSSSSSSFDDWDDFDWPDTSSSSCKNCTSSPLETGLAFGLTFGTVPALFLGCLLLSAVVACCVGTKRRLLGGSERWERQRKERKEEARCRREGMRASGVGSRWYWERQKFRRWWAARRSAKPAVPDVENGAVEQNGEKTLPGVHEHRDGSPTENRKVQVDREQQYEALIQELRIKSPEAVSILKLKTEEERSRMDLDWIRENRELWHGCRRGNAHVKWYEGGFGGSSYRTWGSCGCVRSV